MSDPTAPTPRTLIRAITRQDEGQREGGGKGGGGTGSKASAGRRGKRGKETRGTPTQGVTTRQQAASAAKQGQAAGRSGGTATRSRAQSTQKGLEDPTPRTLIRAITRDQAGDQTITPDTSIAQSTNASSIAAATPRRGDLLQQVLDPQSSMIAGGTAVPSANQSVASVAESLASGPSSRDTSVVQKRAAVPPARPQSPSDTSIWEVLHGKQGTARATKAAPATVHKPQQRQQAKRRAPRRTSTLLPATVIRQILHSATHMRLSPAAVDAVGASLDEFVGTFASQLRSLATQEGRHTLEVADVEALMIRQGLISSVHDLRSLLHEHLPMEFVEQLLPTTVSDNRLHPACKRPKLGQLE